MITTDCLIIGGGVIGLMIAYELRSAGLDVIVVERGTIGRESSWAGGGILSPLYPWRQDDAITALTGWSQNQYPILADILFAETAIDPEWTQSGMLILDCEDADSAIAWSKRYQHAVEVLENRDIRDLVSFVSATDVQALWFSDIAQIRPPRLMQALKKYTERMGVTLLEHTAITRFLADRHCMAGVETETERIATKQIVIACGAWSGTLLQPLHYSLPVEPVRGQMILFRATADLLKPMIHYQNHYLIPRRDGRILAGSTVEYVGFDKSTTPTKILELKEFAIRLLPALNNIPIEHDWAGLRPGSPKGIPFIGPHPTRNGLFINAGHFRNGITLAPASARLMADWILARQPIFDVSPFSLESTPSSRIHSFLH
ncbi:MAG: glycine oxidase ThiO [Candidatus Omnitrophota bacterium]|nr:MAG: glycine oxidase ThiO [Candidatus Omnitrophota bacterium]